MTVFKAYLKILKKNKFIIIMYTGLLLLFGGFNMQSNEQSMSFVSEKPDVMIVNNDSDSKLSNNLVKYLKKNTKVKKIENNKEKIDDALFYREINYVIYIPKDFGRELLNGNVKELDVKSTGDYNASLAEMILSRYINVASIYSKSIDDEDILINKINEDLSFKTKVELTTKLDTTSLERAAFYYNFASYSILACVIYVVCLILSIFNGEKVKRRTLISSTDYKKHNRILLFANCVYSSGVWLFYCLISFLLIGNVIATTNGLFMIINAFIFTICATSLAFLIGSLVSKKEAINGIMNIIAIGSSFLCGAFVPQEYLPDFALKLGHALPAYYYITNNNKLTTLESFDFNSMKSIYINFCIMIIFTLVFIICANIVSSKKRKIA